MNNLLGFKILNVCSLSGGHSGQAQNIGVFLTQICHTHIMRNLKILVHHTQTHTQQNIYYEYRAGEALPTPNVMPWENRCKQNGN